MIINADDLTLSSLIRVEWDVVFEPCEPDIGSKVPEEERDGELADRDGGRGACQRRKSLTDIGRL